MDWTWTCHICHEERPDDKISVVTKPLDFGHGVKADQNIRYCNDRPECFKGTKTFSFVKDKEE
jgi:hypothetical protein